VKRLGRSITGYASDAWACLAKYPWPGNVRELEHVIESACAWARGTRIELSDLPEFVRTSAGADAADRARPLQALAQDYQRACVLDMVERHHGDRTSAAQALGISLSTLKRRLRRR
jgi:DNA-binding NtrC family response regulator